MQRHPGESREVGGIMEYYAVAGRELDRKRFRLKPTDTPTIHSDHTTCHDMRTRSRFLGWPRSPRRVQNQPGRFTMTGMAAIWGAVGVAILAVVVMLWRARSSRSRPNDLGTVSDSWQAEQKMASRDRFSG